ncbi:STELLO glycosyltransferase family protein [uncultured Cohaesibacter sp.]|uniref:STELLO glycosyltransferase family protein n=1 Tax=uncultured Cohaesibacter sp. TaxID=1002546 RepID=UPI0029C9AA4B|nr:STELLO glycosyltransferase family protein [uncultured Cohaesibacter sp.]
MLSVITTIFEPTECVKELSRFHEAYNLGPLIVAGDRKGPLSFDLNNARFLDIDKQVSLFPEFATTLPTNHYARKNVGYLFAMKEGAECIYETDDDNRPNDVWKPRSINVEAPKIVAADKAWVNVYKYFTEAHIWPRGLPLDFVSAPQPELQNHDGKVYAPIQQGLVDNSPDVDAVWRLLFDRPFDFDRSRQHSVLVPPNVWSPFNTQSTWWWPDAYPLMYIPSHCSFRMCDIWKSFVAQRCLWELGTGVVYHAPEVIQERNPHDLMKDFADEVPGYLNNRQIAEYLTGTALLPGTQNVSANLRTCYETLVGKGIFPEQELTLVNLWCDQIESLR